MGSSRAGGRRNGQVSRWDEQIIYGLNDDDHAYGANKECCHVLLIHMARGSMWIRSALFGIHFHMARLSTLIHARHHPPILPIRLFLRILTPPSAACACWLLLLFLLSRKMPFPSSAQVSVLPFSASWSGAWRTQQTRSLELTHSGCCLITNPHSPANNIHHTPNKYVKKSQVDGILPSAYAPAPFSLLVDLGARWLQSSDPRAPRFLLWGSVCLRGRFRRQRGWLHWRH